MFSLQCYITPSSPWLRCRPLNLQIWPYHVSETYSPRTWLRRDSPGLLALPGHVFSCSYRLSPQALGTLFCDSGEHTSHLCHWPLLMRDICAHVPLPLRHTLDALMAGIPVSVCHKTASLLHNTEQVLKGRWIEEKSAMGLSSLHKCKKREKDVA